MNNIIKYPFCHDVLVKYPPVSRLSSSGSFIVLVVVLYYSAAAVIERPQRIKREEEAWRSNHWHVLCLSLSLSLSLSLLSLILSLSLAIPSQPFSVQCCHAHGTCIHDIFGYRHITIECPLRQEPKSSGASVKVMDLSIAYIPSGPLSLSLSLSSALALGPSAFMSSEYLQTRPPPPPDELSCLERPATRSECRRRPSVRPLSLARKKGRFHLEKCLSRQQLLQLHNC
jgi:hypothetical protein